MCWVRGSVTLNKNVDGPPSTPAGAAPSVPAFAFAPSDAFSWLGSQLAATDGGKLKSAGAAATGAGGGIVESRFSLFARSTYDVGRDTGREGGREGGREPSAPSATPADTPTSDSDDLSKLLQREAVAEAAPGIFSAWPPLPTSAPSMSTRTSSTPSGAPSAPSTGMLR